ncbi:MAG: YceI family protein [Chitinophagaceae bacterium]|nr:YceI family protein [Chitinophagaceae bacterium]
MSTSKTKWVIDPTHSEIGFKIRHLMITNVSGTFGKVDITAETEGDNFTTANVNVKIEVDSISTHNSQRDEHLRNADFFEVAKFPYLTFKSSRIEKVDDENFTLVGDLTIKETTKPVELKLEFGGVTKDPWGGSRAGFSLSGKINRHDFGVSYNPVLETGGVALGEEIKIWGDVELVKQAVQEAVAA